MSKNSSLKFTSCCGRMWAGPMRDVQVGTPASCSIVSIDNLEVLQAVVYFCSLENSGSQVAIIDMLH